MSGPDDSLSENEQTLTDRIEACEIGLEAVETILRTTFPQFFITEVSENGDSQTEGSSPAEPEKSAGGETKEGTDA